MPIYEFYCQACHTIFSFFSRSVNTTATPACPRCSGALQRRVSSFAFPEKSRGKKDVDTLPLSEQRLSEGMQKLSREVDKLKDQDPAQAKRMLEKFTSMTGVRFNEMFDKTTAPPADEAEEPPQRFEDEPERDPGLYDL